MTKRATYSVETKAAILAALLEGQSSSQVAKDYEVPRGTVAGWKARQEQVHQSDVANVTTQKSIGELVFKLCESHLEAAIAISIVVRDPQYIKTQDAAGVAVLLGVINDKVFRILEAFDRNARHQDTPSNS